MTTPKDPQDSGKAPWPDDVDEVALEVALAQVPPWRLLGAFKSRNCADATLGCKDVAWHKLDHDILSWPPDGVTALHVCDFCAAEIEGYPIANPVVMYKFVGRPPDSRRWLAGQCRTCGTGFWWEEMRT